MCATSTSASSVTSQPWTVANRSASALSGAAIAGSGQVQKILNGTLLAEAITQPVSGSAIISEYSRKCDSCAAARSHNGISQGSSGARCDKRHTRRSASSARIRMPSDLCHTNRFSFVGEMCQLTATRPSAICTKMSSAISQWNSLAGPVQDSMSLRAMLFLRDRLDLDAQRHVGLEAPLRRVVQAELAAVESAECVGAAPLALQERVRDALEQVDLERDRLRHAVQRELALDLGRCTFHEALELPLVGDRRIFLRVELLRR